MNVNMEDGSQRHGTARTEESAASGIIQSGIRDPNGRPWGTRRLTMAQAVAAKWIERYACGEIDAVDCQAVAVDANCH